MKITCDREKFLGAFQLAASVVPPRSPKPILRNVKLDVSGEKALLMATDLEVGVRIEVADLHVDAPGVALLPTDRFGPILRESGDAKLHLESDGQSTTVRGERSEFRLPAENPDEYPAIAEFAQSKYHEIPARLLREMIRRTVFATDNESTRYALGGVLVEFESDKLTLVGTDGRRLAMMQGPAKSVGGHESGESMTIVPSRAMQLIERMLSDGDAEIQLASRGNDVLLKTPRCTFYTRLVEGRFPKWRDVFPERANTRRLEMAVGPLHSAVRQAAIVTSDESRGVDFAFGDGKLVLTGRAAEMGQSHVELPIAYNDELICVTLDPRYVVDFLKVLDSEKSFTLEIADSESAAVCSTDDGYRYVVMPLARDAARRASA